MHFLISGDSWSQGEWIDNNVTHQGLHQYLLDSGHTVTNVGRGAFDNIEAWEQVMLAMWDNIDHLVFFYTDSLRHARIIDFETQLPSQIVNAHVNWFVEQVTSLKQKYPNLKVTVIGGAGCFPTTSNSIDYIVPSITTLLFPNWEDSPYLFSHRETFQFFLESKKFVPSQEQKTEFIEIMSKCYSKSNFWKSNLEYFPDGSHAGRLGHLKLYKHLQAIWA